MFGRDKGKGKDRSPELGLILSLYSEAQVSGGSIQDLSTGTKNEGNYIYVRVISPFFGPVDKVNEFISGLS